MVGFKPEKPLRTGFSQHATAAKTEHSSVVANGVEANGARRTAPLLIMVIMSWRHAAAASTVA